jgi:hypothetical protein
LRQRPKRESEDFGNVNEVAELQHGPTGRRH